MPTLRSGLTYANVMATVAVFLALVGGAYAAFKLPKNSVGAKQLKKDAVRSAKVKNGSLLANDFKAGQLPRGAKGDPCLASDPACRGPKGAQGPGARSFDGQFSVDSSSHDIALVNGVRVRIACFPANIEIELTAPDTAHSFYGWGTESIDGGAPTEAPVGSSPGYPDDIAAVAGSRAELDVVVRATAPGEAIKWTRVDILGIKGSKCNYHALIIPSST